MSEQQTTVADTIRARLADGRSIADSDVRALLAERDAALARAQAAETGAMRLQDGWLRVIQQENSCPASVGGCSAKRCGCIEEMEMLMQEAEDAR